MVRTRRAPASPHQWPPLGGAVTCSRGPLSDDEEFEFTPKEMKVKVGTTVTWMNAGTTAHSATAIDKSFNTRNLQPGETKSVTFSTPGTFVYHCVFHGNPDDRSGMIGTVIVEP